MTCPVGVKGDHFLIRRVLKLSRLQLFGSWFPSPSSLFISFLGWFGLLTVVKLQHIYSFSVFSRWNSEETTYSHHGPFRTSLVRPLVVRTWSKRIPVRQREEISVEKCSNPLLTILRRVPLVSTMIGVSGFGLHRPDICIRQKRRSLSDHSSLPFDPKSIRSPFHDLLLHALVHRLLTRSQCLLCHLPKPSFPF